MSDDSDRETDPVCSLPAFLVEDQERQDANTLYKYRDFGQVQEDDDDVAEIPPPTPSSRGSAESSIRVQKFPVKLYAILAQKEFHDIICWMPHGRSWKVLKPTMFESLVMPLFFEYSNYHSFNRLVNAWSFRRISSGPDRGSYYHELFLRGKPFLQKYMRRLPKTHKKLPMRKKDEPDFYKLDKTSTLPALEDAPVPGAIATSLALRQQQQQMPQQSLPHLTVSTNHHNSPMTSIVTPPHLSPSLLNANGMGQTGLSHPGGMNGLGNFIEPSLSMNRNDGIVGQSGGMVGPNGLMGMMQSGGMGLGGMGSADLMNQGRLHGGLSQNAGPLPPRFNGYNPPADSYDPQDEYDLQPGISGGGLGGGRGLNGHSMNLNNLNMNGVGFGGYGGGSNGFNNNGGMGGYGDLGMPSRFGGVNSGSANVRRQTQMRQNDLLGSGGAGLDGFSRGNGLGNSQQDFFQSSSFPQQHSMNGTNQLSPNQAQLAQRSHQLQQQFHDYDSTSRTSPPPSTSSQLMNNNNLANSSMSQQLYGRGMGNGSHDDFGLRRSMSRV